jgi:methyl-accepting chemotaxis protein
VQQAADRTGEVSRNISGVTTGTAETGSAAREVLASAVNLAQQSETLRAEVNRFLSSIRAA